MRSKKSVIACALTAVLLLSWTAPAAADTQSELQNAQQERERSAASLVTVQERIASIEAKKGETEAYLKELNTQLSDLTAELGEIQQDYKVKLQAYDTANQQLIDAEAERDEQQQNMAVRIQYIYENSTDVGLIHSVLSADSFTDMLNRAVNVAELSAYDRELLDQYEATCEEVEQKKQIAEKDWNDVVALEKECDAKRSEIQEVYEKTLDDVKELEASITEEQKKESELMAEIQAQEERISALIVQAAAEAAVNVTVHVHHNSESGEAEYTVVSEEGEEVTVSASEAHEYVNSSTWEGPVLTKKKGVNQGPNGKETWYNDNMKNCVQRMRNMGNEDEYWVREDGVKMLGDYVMVAANLETHPRGSIVESSLGTAIVVDTGGFAKRNKEQLDIAVEW